MVQRFLRLLTALIAPWLGLGWAMPVSAGMGLAPGAAFQEETPGLAPGQPWSFEAMLEHDKDYSFPPRAGQAALDSLQRELRNPDRIAAALYTLGETQSSSARSNVEPWLARGTVEIRCAAVTAWGLFHSLTDGEDPYLVQALSDPSLQVAESALFALYLNSRKPALDRLAFLVANPDQPLAPAAEHILQWHERGTCSEPGPVSRRLELRWKAARAFGTVRGKVWTALLLENLARDASFVDQSLLFEAGSLLDPRVPDHLLEWLLLHPAEEAPAMGVLLGMPAAMDRLVEQGIWVPQTPGQFEAIVTLAESRGLLRLIPGTLARLALQPEYSLRVAGWLVAVDPRYEDGIEGNLISPDPATRAQAVRAAGQAGLAGWVSRLREMSRDPDSLVRIEALIARVREGDRELAWRPIRAMFVEEREKFSDAEREWALKSMLAAHDSRVLDLVHHVRAAIEPGQEHARLSTILLLGGRSPSSEGVRASLSESMENDFWSLQMIRALGKSRLAEDRLFLEKSFPDPNSYPVNMALANALLAHSSEVIIPLLKFAVWNGDFNQSSLAAILVADRYGPLRLMQWLERPPEGVGVEDLRRVGFTVGSLGGKEALDLLARHLGAASGAERPELQGALLGVLSARTY